MSKPKTTPAKKGKKSTKKIVVKKPKAPAKRDVKKTIKNIKENAVLRSFCFKNVSSDLLPLLFQ